MKNILVIFGTRPEVIKLAPVILKFRQLSSEYNVIVCNTEQQKQLSKQTLNFFNLTADIELDCMRNNQSLSEIQCRILTGLSKVFLDFKIDATIVQGDTMSAYCGSLVSFYNKIPVFHVEAGLRSHDIFEPFPEEALRQMISRITDIHFAPTEQAKLSLIKENISKKKIFITGNTVIDALSCLNENILETAYKNLLQKGISFSRNMVLVTVHRRENHGERLNSILNAIYNLAITFKDHQFILPVHPNPNVHNRIYEKLGNIPNIILTAPLDYPALVTLLKNTKLVLTDSGGIQEEAPSFGNPVLVMRYETERTEGIRAGFALLVGTDSAIIEKEASKILSCDMKKTRVNSKKNPYGDGYASERILAVLRSFFRIKDHI